MKNTKFVIFRCISRADVAVFRICAGVKHRDGNVYMWLLFVVVCFVKAPKQQLTWFADDRGALVVHRRYRGSVVIVRLACLFGAKCFCQCLKIVRAVHKCQQCLQRICVRWTTIRQRIWTRLKVPSSTSARRTWRVSFSKLKRTWGCRPRRWRRYPAAICLESPPGLLRTVSRGNSAASQPCARTPAPGSWGANPNRSRAHRMIPTSCCRSFCGTAVWWTRRSGACN